MSLADQISETMKEAMRAKDSARLSALRMIKSDLQKAEIQQGAALTTEQEHGVLRKMAKQRREAIEQFRAGGRAELADKEAAELKLIESLLPASLSEAEIDALIDEVFANSAEQLAGTTTGILMGKIMDRLKATGRPFDGKAASARVMKRLKA